MNSAIMQLEIEKAKCKKELDELDIKLIRLLNELSSKSIPYYKNIEDIRAAEIEQIGDELLKTQQEALKCEKKLKQIKRDLGQYD